MTGDQTGGSDPRVAARETYHARLCPIDGAPLAMMSAALGGPTFYRHEDGTGHLDPASDALRAPARPADGAVPCPSCASSGWVCSVCDYVLEDNRDRCDAYHPEYGFTCPWLPRGHGALHFDASGGYWDEHGQVAVDRPAAADGACCQKCGETYECGSEMPVDTDSPVTPACARPTGHGGWHCDHVRVWDQETGEGQSGDALDADEAVSGPVGARGGERELATERVRTYLDAIEAWRPEIALIDRHHTGEQLRIADLRALSSSTGSDSEGGEE